jgi:glycosyltransferase involved in cell wall biosynthesis
MKKAEHIHLRCPGNMGLIGCVAQVFFPQKMKSAKYAANWDLKSKQPFSYRIQQRLIRNTAVTKNMTGLVYGVWPNHTANIKPFFTASYTKDNMRPLIKKRLDHHIHLLFVGMLKPGKQPLLSAKVCHQLDNLHIPVTLHIYGEGSERQLLQKFIEEHKMQDKIILYGNQSQLILQDAYQKCQFLIFLSKSEGWPKAVAEAMWWGCLPITSAVSCVPEMIGYGERGETVGSSVDEVSHAVMYYKSHPDVYHEKCIKAAAWARKYTLELFENEIQKIIQIESASTNR